MLGRRSLAALTGLLALTSGVALAPSASAAAPTKLVSLTTSATSVNTDGADALVTVRVRVQDADGVATVQLYGHHVDAAATPMPGYWDAYVDPFDATATIPRVSGTAHDGVYEGRLRVRRSTNGVIELGVGVGDQLDDGGYWAAAQLRALGLTSQFTTVSTATAPKLGNLSGRSLTGTGAVGGFPVITRTSTIAFSLGAGYAGGVQVVKQSGCADPSWIQPTYPATSPILYGGRFYTPCSITLRTYNGLGYGPSVTLNYL